MLNKTAYDALPYAYIAAGVMTVLLLDSRVKILPALLLIAAGLLVMAWRGSENARAQRLMHTKRGPMSGVIRNTVRR